MGVEQGRWSSEGGDCASVPEELGAWFLQDYEKKVCFEDVGAVAKDDWPAVTEASASVTEEEAKKIRVRIELEEVRDGEQGELHFGIARDV